MAPPRFRQPKKNIPQTPIQRQHSLEQVRAYVAEHQPVLLTTAMDTPNAAQALFLIDGAEPGDLSPHERCIVLFDGRDESALAGARTRWKAFKAGGHPVSYWRQGEQRGWEKIA